MNKLLVSVFDNDEKAFEGLSALKDLHQQGDITLYASTIIAKDANGVAKVRDAAEDAPVGTLVGIFGGAVVGLIAGPVGAAVGAYVGGLGGMFYDLFRYGISMDFVDEVTKAIEPGTVAVVADVDESWVAPVDTRLAPLGARIYRRIPSEEMDNELNREVELASTELTQLQAEMREANQEAKAGIQSSIDAKVKKLHELDERIQRWQDKVTAEFEARMSTLKAQWQHARDERKADIDARMAELKADHQARQAKLDQARELSKEAAQLRKEALSV